MIERHLKITLEFARQAAQRAQREFFDEVRQNIRKTADEQSRSERDYVRAVRVRVRAINELEKDLFRQSEARARARVKNEVDGARIAAQARRQAERQSSQRSRDEARVDRQREADHDKRSAADRLAFYVDQAKAKSEIAHRTSREAVQVASTANAALRRGEEELAEAHQLVAEGKVRTSREAAEKSAGFAKKAASQINAATKGEGDAARETARAIVAGAKNSSEDAARYAERGSRAVVTSWKRAGDGQRDEARKTKSALEEQQEAIMNVSRAYTTMRIGAEVGQAIRAAMQASADSAKDARDHIKGMIDETERLRDRSAEVLAMKNMPAGAASVAQQMGLYAAAGVTPDQGIAAEEAFQQEMAGMVEPARLDPGQKAASYRLSGAQAERLQKYAMGIAASQGMDQGSAMLMLGTIASKAPVGADGKVDADVVEEQFAKNFGLLQKARGSTATDARQFAEAAQKLVGQGGAGVDVNRLAVMTAAQAEIRARGVRMHLDALFRGLDQVRDDEEKGDALGITGDMDDMRALDAATEAIRREAKAENTSVRRVARRHFGRQEVADAFVGHIEQGIEGGIYERAAGVQSSMTADKGREMIAAHMGSRRGVAARQQSESAQATARQAAQYEDLTEFRRQAGIGVVSGGMFEVPERWDQAMLSRIGQQYGHGTPFEMEQERLALYDIETGLGNYPEGEAFLDRHGPLTADTKEPIKAEAARLRRRLAKSGRGGVPGQGAKPRPRNPFLGQGGITHGVNLTLPNIGFRSVPPTAPRAGMGGPAMPHHRMAANAGGGHAPFTPSVQFGPNGELLSAHRSAAGHLHLSAPGSNGRTKGWLTPGSDHHIDPRIRSAMRRGLGAANPIAIRTDADGRRHAEWAANTRALSEPRRRAAASASAEAANRAAANKASHDSERARAAMHIAENHRFLEARRVAARPTPRANIPKPEFPDSGFGRGPLARAAGGMLKPGPGMPGNYAPAPGTYPRRVATTSGFGSGYEPEGWMFSPPNMAPNGLPGANAIQGWAGRWGRGEYATRGDEGINALRILGGGRPGGGGGGGDGGARHLKEAANALKESARGPVPSAMPGKPNVMRN